MAAVLSSNSVSDGQILPFLLKQVEEPINQVSGDGAYDQLGCYEALQEPQKKQKLKVTIPPRQGARI